MIKSIVEIKPIREYLSRIGAEPRSLNKAVITTKIGKYWKDTYSIKFTKDGIIVVSNSEYAPTNEEQDEIKKAWDKAEIPVCIPVNNLKKLPKAVKQNSYTYEFRSIDGKEILMLQSRIKDSKSGEKKYIPWTYWNDGHWRCTEPDGKLPLYGLETLKDHEVIFIHEGAKSAEHAQQISEDKIDHPWSEELKYAAHLGWIGGALNPGRTDWSPLKRAGIKRAYIVADNDEPGRASIVHISKRLRCITFSLQFTDEFPMGFDLADKMPEDLHVTIDKHKHYLGPAFSNMLHPATWMTDKIPQEKGRPIIELRECAKDLWAYVENIDMIICKEIPALMLRQEITSKSLAPFSHSDNTAKMIIKNQRGRTTNISYRPDKKGLRITNKETSSINIHTPSTIKAIKGDISTFLKFLNYMFPNKKECTQLQRWLATLIARPDIRIGFGILLISEKQGIGKTTLAEMILAPLVGWSNVSFPNEMSFQSSFNGWAANKRLLIVNEIYQGHSWKVYNMLKSIITDRNIEVNIKHLPPYTVDNFCHIYACSNSMGALKMNDEDRRWFIPEMTKHIWTFQQFKAFRKWVASGGLNIIRHWSEGFNDYIDMSEHAPKTETKTILIEEGQSKMIQHVIKFANKYTNSDKPVCVAVSELHDSIARMLKNAGDESGKWEKKTSVMSCLLKQGMIGIEKRIHINGTLQHICINASLEHELKASQGNFTELKVIALKHLISFEEAI